MSKREQVMIVINSDSYKDANFSKLSRQEKAAAISAATRGVDEKVQAWFKQNGHDASTRAFTAVGSIFIGCTPEAAAAFEQAVADNKIPGVTGVLRNAQDVAFELLKPVKESDPAEGDWAKRTKREDFGVA